MLNMTIINTNKMIEINKKLKIINVIEDSYTVNHISILSGIGYQTVYRYLKELQEKGFLQREKNKPLKTTESFKKLKSVVEKINNILNNEIRITNNLIKYLTFLVCNQDENMEDHVKHNVSGIHRKTGISTKLIKHYNDKLEYLNVLYIKTYKNSKAKYPYLTATGKKLCEYFDQFIGIEENIIVTRSRESLILADGRKIKDFPT